MSLMFVHVCVGMCMCRFVCICVSVHICRGQSLKSPSTFICVMRFLSEPIAHQFSYTGSLCCLANKLHGSLCLHSPATVLLQTHATTVLCSHVGDGSLNSHPWLLWQELYQWNHFFSC